MMEKVRLSVDRETETVLNAISEQLKRTLSSEPAWAAQVPAKMQELLREELHGEGSLREKVDALMAISIALEKAVEASAERLDGDVMGTIQSHVSEHSRIVEAAEALASRQARLEENLERVEGKIHRFEGTLESLIKAIRKKEEILIKTTANNEESLKKILQELAAQRRRMAEASKPWWRRLFGGKK